MHSLLIQGAVIADAHYKTGRHADVLVKDGQIADIFEADSVVPAGAEIFDAAGCAMIPGLINGHMHAHANLGKGLGDRWTLEMSLTQAPGVVGSRTIEMIYVSTLIGAAEMLLKGCTATYDMVLEYPLPTSDGFNAVAQAYADAGMRAVIAPMVADTAFATAIPGLSDTLKSYGFDKNSASPDAAQLLQCLRKILHDWSWSPDGIRLALGPTIPMLCSDAFMTGCRDLAREYEVGIHTHLSESKVQAVTALSTYGKSITKHLADLEMLNPSLTCAHAVWLDREDLSRIADSGATIIHNPGSNFRLGSGIADTRAMMNAGVVLGLGTDGATCADSLNMFEAMRLMSHTSRSFGRPHTDWMTALEVLDTATKGSAHALGFGTDIGHIKIGSKADVVLLDLKRPHYVPLNDLVSQIVYGEDSSGVRDVFVGGKPVVRNRKLTMVDYESLIHRANIAALELQEQTQNVRAQTAQMAQVVAAFCHGMIESPLASTHYVPHQQAYRNR